ncbi:MAG: 50S ribosomal protein L40e [Nanoarchaeota archaeon]|nr:50S ribosomal protein L40e [Nanoarchaeota archaeon]MBU1321225.1 50S ribosomal protein L40e [Nanoarchaeota archaeon]MBU1597030.1 50S ribosomal protein L40e [Nanoarchaeota archaeon]MBU2441824.1 50S ribosomal protein L40e [Nanoarchaeota archaeon]
MVKFPEAEARLFKNIFVCRKCKSKVRASNLKVIAGKIRCRKCNSKVLRPIKKK